MKEYIKVIKKIISSVFRYLYEALRAYLMAIGISYRFERYAHSINIDEDFDITSVATTIFIIYIMVIFFIRTIRNISSVTDINDKELENPSFVESDLQKDEIVCVHEAGHALMSYLLNRNDICVYINEPIPHTNVTFQQYLSSVQYLKENVMIYYASIVAQRILGKESTGFYGVNNSNSDIENANLNLHDILLLNNHDLSLTGDDDETRQEMSRLSKELYAKTEHVLREHIDELKEITAFLLKHRTADKNDIRKICEKGNK